MHRIIEVDSFLEVPSHCQILLLEKESKSLDYKNFRTLARIIRRDKDLSNFRILSLDTQAYTYFEEVQKDLHSHFLANKYPLDSYGKEWIIIKPDIHISLLLLPYQFLAQKENTRLIDLFPKNNLKKTPITLTGLREQNLHLPERLFWMIVDKGFEHIHGLYTSQEQIYRWVFSKPTQELYGLLWQCKNFSSYEEVDPTRYKYKLVIQKGGKSAKSIPNRHIFLPHLHS